MVMMIKMMMVMNEDDDSDNRLRDHTSIDDAKEMCDDVGADNNDDVGDEWH